MTDQQRPTITPPPDLQEQWKQEWLSVRPSLTSFHEWMLAKSAQWGADQELEACCVWLTTKAMTKPWETVPRPVLVTTLVLELRAACRPKPPSLKEQALEDLDQIDGHAVDQLSAYVIHDDLKQRVSNIRRALEALPNE